MAKLSQAEREEIRRCLDAEEPLPDKYRFLLFGDKHLSKDASGAISNGRLTKTWSDGIDYWSADFDYESKREMIGVSNPDTGEVKEEWTGEYVFKNEWQSFRAKEDRSLELKSAYHAVPSCSCKIAVKVVDIFGNDTMTLLEVKT